MEFSCVAIATEILFYVNETSASDSIVADKGFDLLHADEVNDTTSQRNLTATALTQYDNTEVYCVALIVVSRTEIKSIPSDVAILRVQG